MAQVIVTAPMKRKAETLAALVPTFHTGRSKRDGTQFVIVPGSTPTVAHWATAYGCTCVGFRQRGTCTHQLAVKIAQTVAPAPAPAPKPAPRRKSYAELFGPDED
jgi:hypothetical protein